MVMDKPAEILRSEPRAAEPAAMQRELRALFSSAPFLVVVDLVLVLSAYLAAWLIRMHVPLPMTQELLPQERWGVVDHQWWLLLGGQVFFLYIFGLYDDLRSLRYREVLGHVLPAAGGHVVLQTTFFYFTNAVFPRSVLLIFGLLEAGLLGGWRCVVKRTLETQRHRVVVVGEDLHSAAELAREMVSNPWMGYEVVGIFADGEASTGEPPEFPLLGSLADAPRFLRELGVEEVIFASQQNWKDRILDALSGVQLKHPLRIAIYPSIWDITIGRLRHVTVHDTPLIEVRRTPNEPIARLVKRTFDISVSLLGLVLLAPLFALIAAAVRFTSPGPVFYRQERVGLGGNVFRLIKFRTMVPDAEAAEEERLACPGDPRITPIGAVLRRFRLDELPQLVNVLRGDMSFVGPRPERPGFVARYSRELPGYQERHKVKPGMTGLAQVRGYYDTSPEKKLKYDLAYIYNYRFTLDLLILLETLKVILTRRGS